MVVLIDKENEYEIEFLESLEDVKDIIRQDIEEWGDNEEYAYLNEDGSFNKDRFVIIEGIEMTIDNVKIERTLNFSLDFLEKGTSK